MAIKRWIGNAAAVNDLWTISLSGTVTSQTFSMTINLKSVTYASTSLDTVATVLAALVTAWNASRIPEFTELTAAGVPIGSPFTSMTLTGDTAGKPSTISVSTSGSATFTIVNTTPATGPNDFANFQNWSNNVAPVNGDVLIFDSGFIPCKYNLGSTLTGITINIDPGFAGTIGLSAVNSDSQNTYIEYRTIALTLAGGTAVINSASISRCNLAFGGYTATVRVLATGQRIDRSTPVVLITGGNSASEIDITKGDVGLANYRTDSAMFPMVRMGYVNQANSDAQLFCGANAFLTTINKNGGALVLNSNVTTMTQGIAGGVTTIVDGTVTTLDVLGGTVNYNSAGTIGTLMVANGASVSFDGDPRPVTVTNPIQIFGDKASVSDNQKRINSGTLTVQLENTQALDIGTVSDR